MKTDTYQPIHVGKEPPLVSVIIVNFNGLRFMDECIRTLANAFDKYPFEIVVVDNSSSDGSQDWLRARDDIVYVESKLNTGFTGGNNLGAAHASGQRLLFINNDTRVISKLDILVDLLDDSEIGLAACRLQYGDMRQQYSFGFDHSPIRIALSWLGVEKWHSLPTVFRRLETNPAAYLRDHDNLDWTSGACFVIRTTDWVSLRGFDTAFFMYCEDVDLCVRIRQLGKRVAYTADCQVIHYEGSGKAWIGYAALKRTVRSYQIFTMKHYGNSTAILLSIWLGVIFLSRSAVFYMLALASDRNRAVRKEKATGFWRAGALLFSSLSPTAMKAPNP